MARKNDGANANPNTSAAGVRVTGLRADAVETSQPKARQLPQNQRLPVSALAGERRWTGLSTITMVLRLNLGAPLSRRGVSFRLRRKATACNRFFNRPVNGSLLALKRNSRESSAFRKTAPLFAEESELTPLKLHLCERLPNLQPITRKQFAAARPIQLTFKERCNEGHARYCPTRFVRLVRPTRALRTRRPSSR